MVSSALEVRLSEDRGLGEISSNLFLLIAVSSVCSEVCFLRILLRSADIEGSDGCSISERWKLGATIPPDADGSLLAIRLHTAFRV